MFLPTADAPGAFNQFAFQLRQTCHAPFELQPVVALLVGAVPRSGPHHVAAGVAHPAKDVLAVAGQLAWRLVADLQDVVYPFQHSQILRRDVLLASRAPCGDACPVRMEELADIVGQLEDEMVTGYELHYFLHNPGVGISSQSEPAERVELPHGGYQPDEPLGDEVRYSDAGPDGATAIDLPGTADDQPRVPLHQNVERLPVPVSAPPDGEIILLAAGQERLRRQHVQERPSRGFAFRRPTALLGVAIPMLAPIRTLGLRLEVLLVEVLLALVELAVGPRLDASRYAGGPQTVHGVCLLGLAGRERQKLELLGREPHLLSNDHHLPPFCQIRLTTRPRSEPSGTQPKARESHDSGTLSPMRQ